MRTGNNHMTVGIQQRSGCYRLATAQLGVGRPPASDHFILPLWSEPLAFVLRVLEDGRVAMDNNATDRPAPDWNRKKNWLLAPADTFADIFERKCESTAVGS